MNLPPLEGSLVAAAVLLIVVLLLEFFFGATSAVYLSFVPALVWAGIIVAKGRR